MKFNFSTPKTIAKKIVICKICEVVKNKSGFTYSRYKYKSKVHKYKICRWPN